MLPNLDNPGKSYQDPLCASVCFAPFFYETCLAIFFFFFFLLISFLLHFTSLFFNGLWDEWFTKRNRAGCLGIDIVFYFICFLHGSFSSSSCFFFQPLWHGIIDLHRGGSMLFSFSVF